MMQEKKYAVALQHRVKDERREGVQDLIEEKNTPHFYYNLVVVCVCMCVCKRDNIIH